MVYFLNSPQYFPHALSSTIVCFLMLAPRMAELDRRFSTGGGRLFFYLYYPAHLAVLQGLAVLR